MFLMFFHQYLTVRKGNVCCDLRWEYYLMSVIIHLKHPEIIMSKGIMKICELKSDVYIFLLECV